MKTIIEHLDPNIWKWSLLEYSHISKITGKQNLTFTNVKKGNAKLKKLKLGRVQQKSVAEIDELKNKKLCILDPKSKKILSPKDKFDYYIFGGVLGNHPMDGRTEKELTQKLTQKKGFKNTETRNLGNIQMSTDTAVLTAHKIIDLKIPFNKIKFKNKIEIEIENGFSTELPYRYIIENRKPVLPKGLIELLKSEDNTF